MAEEFAVVIVGKVVEKLIDPIIRQFSYIFFYRSNIKRLADGVDDLQNKKSDVTLSVDAHNRNLQIIGRDVESWLAKVEVNEKEAREVLEGTKIVKNGCLNGWCPRLKQRYVVSRKAVKQLVVVKELQTNGEKYTLTAYPALPTGTVVSISTHPAEVFESRISLTKDVVEALKDGKFMIIGICGLGGVGKTTMAKEIRDIAITENICDEVAMAVVSENPDLKKVQDELASMLGLTLEGNTVVDVRGKKLCERLMKGKRTLIVLDDVWKNLDLGELGIPMGGRHEFKGCKVLITSRDEHVCTVMGTEINFAVKHLSSTESWDLFKEKAGVFEETVELNLIAREISEECGGLPLAIVTVGSALKGRGKDEWQDALEQLQMSNVTSIPGMENVYTRLRLSYNLLENDQLRRLFLVCCTYPEDYDIPVEELVRYSVGVKLFDYVLSLEKVRRRVNSLVNQLKSCYLLLDSNKPRRVKVHDVLRDFGLKEASQGKHVCLVGDHAKLEHYIQNNSVEHCTEISIRSEKQIELPPYRVYPLLQCLTLSSGGVPRITEGFFGGMKELNFVYFIGQKISFASEPDREAQPPEYFMNVRTLCLEDCRTDSSIKFIGKFQNLEILSFIGSYKVSSLPYAIGDLVNLKLLDLRDCDVGFICPGVLSSLKKLEELYMGEYFYGEGVEKRNNGECASISELYSLSALKTLQISISMFEVFSKLNDFFFDKLILFDIYCNQKQKSKDEEFFYDLPNRLVIDSFDLSDFTWEKIRALFKTSKVLCLFHVGDFKNAVKESDEIACTTLKELDLTGTNDLVEIFHGSLPAGFTAGMLEKVTLEDLSGLKNLWSAPVHPSSFKNLTSFIIGECDAIQSLFSLSVARCLEQLEILDIYDCKMLNGVIFLDETEDEENAKMTEFPKLREVKLSKLPSLENFVTFSNSCGSTKRMSFPSMELLQLVYVDATMIMVNEMQTSSSIHQLKFLELVNCQTLSCISSTFDETRLLQKLVNLFVDQCKIMETVFDLEGVDLSGNHDSEVVICGELESIKLRELDDLRHIWRNFPKQGLNHPNSFCKLKKLRVKKCDKLKYIFTPSMVRLLVNLQVIKIDRCMNLEQVILFDDVEEVNEIEMKMIEFPNLTKVALNHLPSMKNFVTYSNGSGHSCNGSLFTKMISLPSIITLSLGETKLIKIVFDLKQIGSLGDKLTCDGDELHCLDGDIFGTTNDFQSLVHLPIKSFNYIETVFDMEGAEDSKEVVFGKLHSIELESLVKLRHIWRHFPTQGLVQRSSFGELKKLKIEKCHELKYIFSPSMVRQLVNLEEIEIHNCINLEQVVLFGEEEKEDDDDDGDDEEEEEEDDDDDDDEDEDDDDDDAGHEIEKKIIEFPKVKRVRLSQLPSMKNFVTYENKIIEFPKVKRVRLSQLPSMKNFVTYSNGSDQSRNESLFTTMIALPSLEALHLEEMNAITTVFGGKIISSDHKLTRNGASFDDTKLLQNLQVLTVKSCNSIETLFDFEEIDDSEVMIFGKLKKIQVIEPSSLHNLRALRVSHCNKLRYLLSLSMTKRLVNLQCLDVIYCEMMGQVIMIKEEEIFEDEKQMDTTLTLLPMLSELMLYNLPNLISFYNGSRDLEFSSLEYVYCGECPSIENFCSKSVSTPRLESVEHVISQFWYGDLNATIRKMNRF